MATRPSDNNAAPSPFEAAVGGGGVEVVSGQDNTGEAAQGRTREIIAVWLLGLLCAIVGLAFTAYFLTLDGVAPDKRFENLKTLLDVLVGPILTLLSSAIGFYFGARSAQGNNTPPAPSPPPAPPAAPTPAPLPNRDFARAEPLDLGAPMEAGK